MPPLVWDEPNARIFNAGLDRGVLYLPGTAGVPWNGLTSVEEASTHEVEPLQLDGLTYLNRVSVSDFTGKLSAYTFPDEFDLCQGTAPVATGMFAHQQRLRPFGLSYRTKLGNGIDGIDHGYIIHLLYNVTAQPEAVSRTTIGDRTEASEFSWDLYGVPETLEGHRPTAHISLRSIDLDPVLLAELEDRLYGSSSTDAYLPAPEEVVELLETFAPIVTITDLGDGLWSASGPDSVFDISGTEFTITHVDADYLDADTYEVRTTGE